MAKNRLILNSDKTHLLIMASTSKHRTHQDFNITLDTGNEIIKPEKYELLLGGFISNDLTWNEHIRDNKKSMIKKLTSRVNILTKVAQIADFKTRKMIANGIIMSTIVYIIQAWGNCSEALLSSIQIIQNKAARLVCKASIYTPISTLLRNCGWLSVRQLVVYHSLLLLFKIKRDKKPVYFYQKFSRQFHYGTRLADSGGIRFDHKVTNEISKENFSYKFSNIGTTYPPNSDSHKQYQILNLILFSPLLFLLR